MNLADIANAIAPISTICGFIVAVGGLVLFGWRLRKQVITVGERAATAARESTRAAAKSTDAADTSAQTKLELADTREALDTATAALNASTAALDTVRKAHDDLFAAFLRSQTVEGRLRLTQQGLADLETEMHDIKTRLISTTGAAHVHTD